MSEGDSKLDFPTPSLTPSLTLRVSKPVLKQSLHSHCNHNINKTLINQHHSWRNPQIAYAFWAVVGKTISIKSHAYYNKGSMHALERRKINNKYVDMPEELILERWPAFVEQLEQALIFHKLREG